MSKKFIAIILSIVLTSFNFYGISYSFASESTIDLLIENNQKQKELQDEISKIEYEIQSKKEINKN